MSSPAAVEDKALLREKHFTSTRTRWRATQSRCHRAFQSINFLAADYTFSAPASLCLQQRGSLSAVPTCVVVVVGVEGYHTQMNCWNDIEPLSTLIFWGLFVEDK